MLLRTASALVLLLTATTAWAEIPPLDDDLYAAYRKAVSDLQAGKERRKIAAALRPVVEKHRDSVYFRLVQPFAADLAETADKQPADDAPPEQRLSQSRTSYHLLMNPGEKNSWLEKALEEQPDDPVHKLISSDRTVIEKLIPLLEDRTPTRLSHEQAVSGFPPPQPRVCDVALAIIQHHACCLFFRDSHQGAAFHALPAEQRKELARHIAEWWRENQDKSVAAGVKAQLPHATSYPEKVWMAKMLIRLAKDDPAGDREFGLETLRQMVRDNRRSFVAAYAADALAEFGDTSSVDLFYHEWTTNQSYDAHIAFYLCKHGKRREWELLESVALEELAAGKKPSEGAVWSCVINSGVATSQPYAIRILGHVVNQVEKDDGRFLREQAESQLFSYLGTATGYLQKQVGQDFGYQNGRTLKETLAAARKAQQWWTETGDARYTFDYIEENLIPAKPALRK